jgi:hypothetical protein
LSSLPVDAAERSNATISAPRHLTKPENTKALRGAGALDFFVRLSCKLF